MKIVRIHVTDDEGQKHRLEGIDGWRLMEVIKDHGLPIPAACGGAGACATCHVYVAADWFEKLIPADSEEAMMLQDAMSVAENSRLSCQIILTPGLDGLEVTLAPNP